ncbi:MAG: PQQ-binding-like beta-propeller repeat protein [Planctomycetota bacterium]
MRVTDTTSSRSRLHRTLLLAAPLVLGLTACKSFRYGTAAWMRGDPDYDALDEQRGEAAPEESAIVSEVAPPYWTQYRGPHGDGTYDEQPLLTSWPDGGPPRLWRAAVGPSYSSMVVAEGLVITMEQRRERESVVAFSLASGEVVWEHSWEARFYNSASKEGPLATPAIEGDTVVALGAVGELRAVDLRTGELRWRRALLEDGEENLEYGVGASPRIEDGVVFVQGAEGVHAIDLTSGNERWSALPETMAYAAPVLADVLGRRTLIVSTAERVVGLSSDSGEELWTFPWKVSHGLACTQPVVLAPDRILVSAGYGKGSRVVSLEGGEDGVVADIVWRSGRFKTRYNEPVRIGERVYGLDEGMLACIDPNDGRRNWKSGRYGYGQLLVHQEKLLVVDERGTVHLLEVDGGEPVELASFEAVEGEMLLNVPALAHGRLFVRSERELVCYDLRVQEP